MRDLRRSIALSAAFVALTAITAVKPALALDPDFAAIEAQENAANSKPGPRVVPGRAIPVPGTVSPQLQATIAAPYRIPAWDADPKSAAEWKDLITKLADAGIGARREAREKLGVTMEPTVIGGVKAFILTPKEIRPENRNRLLIHVHGGGYVYNPGEAGTGEGTLMAAFGGYKVISIDYRMPPDFPSPRRRWTTPWRCGGQNAEPAQHGDLLAPRPAAA
jgi:epsilon-lactone hydrolase